MLRGTVTSLTTSLCLIAIFQGAFSVKVSAQRQYSVERPRERPSSEQISIATTIMPTNSVLAVVLNPVINAQVVIKDLHDKPVQTQDAGEAGQAEFELERSRIYKVEVSAPNYVAVSKTSNPMGVTPQIMVIRLVQRFASINFPPLPADSQILIDDILRATAGEGGTISIDDLAPGNHTLLIRHPEYNDYSGKLENLEAGATVTYPRIPLTRVAKLTIQDLAGAVVLVNGAFWARIGPAG